MTLRIPAMDSRDRLTRLRAFLSERFPIEKMNVAAMVTHKEVPVHRLSWAYYLGGLALFAFSVQVVTGLMLLFYYQPTVSDAHASVEYITEQVPAGALVRNLHAWASSLMIAGVMAHALTAFAMKAFARPREVTWLTGVGLLGVTFAFGFTGYLLPWHQIAVNATKIGLQTIEEIGAYLPGQLAEWPRALRETIQGEASVGQSTLSRFFALHAIILPFSIGGLLAVHLLSVQLHGMSEGIDPPSPRREPFFPTFVLKDLAVWGVAFVALFVIGACLPFESLFAYPLFEPYSAKGSTPDGIKPEWYFFWVYYPLELLPFWLILVGQLVLGAGLVAVPWLLRDTRQRTLRLLAVGAGGYLLLMTLFGDAVYRLFRG